MIPGLFFTYGFVALFLATNALRRPSPPTSRFPALWLPAMLVAELTPMLLAARAVITLCFVALGALSSPVGRAGLTLVIAATVLTLPQFLRTRRAITDIAPLVPVSASSLAERVTRRDATGVKVLGHVPYHESLTLDLYRPLGSAEPSPCLVYIHGGSWSGGDPHRQSRTLFLALARRGWLVATIRYPLSPDATFPDHLVGVKRALAWAKAAGSAWGIDGSRLALAGGSAGAHLASLAALTAGRSDLQPGFEDVDTTVSACVPMYGIYDFLNRHETRFDWPFIARDVMKARPHEDEERYRLASPLDQVGEAAPPFLVVHGSHDSLVPPAEGRVFVETLEAVSDAPVEYYEVHGGQHGFDAIASPRTRAVSARIVDYLERHLG